MRAPADIAVYDENDQISALVEVRAVPQSTPEWAVAVRREIIEAGAFTPRYFFVVARDFAYLWTSPTPPDALPDETLRTDDVFQYYLRYINTDSRSIAPSALELMVGIWLSDMTLHADRTADVRAVEESGLPSVVAKGRVEFLAAA